MSKRTRAKSGGMEPDVVFPSIPSFVPKSQLPTTKSIIGVLRHLTAGRAAQTRHDMAVKEVSKQVYAKWYHDTIYCMSLRSIERKVGELWGVFREGKKRYAAGRSDGKAITRYKEIAEKAEQLFDVFASTEKRELVSVRQSGVSA